MPKVQVPRPKAKAYNLSPNWQEFEFIDKLGSWAKHDQKPEGTGLTRLQLLCRYLDTMHLRRYWGKINPDEIRAYVKAAILEEERDKD